MGEKQVWKASKVIQGAIFFFVRLNLSPPPTVGSYLAVSLSRTSSLLSSLLPVLARARSPQSCDANARFFSGFFLNETLNAVLHLSELSDQLE